LAAYLVTEGVAAHAEQDGDDWAIWVRDENHLGKAREAFQDFRANPEDKRYQNVVRTAVAIQEEEVKRREAARQNVVEMRGKWGKGGGTTTSKRAPLVFVLIGLCVLASLWTKSLNGPAALHNDNKEAALLSFAESDTRAAAFVNIQQGEVWRLLTPIFPHIGALHLVMNMYWLYRFGAQIEHFDGTVKLGLLVIVIALISNTAQAAFTSPNFFGISGVVGGLFGYVWIKSRYDPNSQLFVHQTTVLFFIGYFFLCLLAHRWFPVANTAHFVGLGVGVVLAYLPVIARSSTGK
jgi:GlpG protein